MKARLVLSIAVGAYAASLPVTAVADDQRVRSEIAREGRLPIAGANLFVRDIGHGRSIIVLHGGPDFDHSYLLPELDRLADSYRLIYYDQRGRGRSANGVQPDDVTLASDTADLDAVRKHFRLDSAILLGHSWGTVLALEYALRHPERVSKLILMNPAPASKADLAMFRDVYMKKLGADMDRQKEILASAAYQDGDPETVTARYRLHFKPALMRHEDYEKLMARMHDAFIRQGKDGIKKARAVEDRLMRDTWQLDGYDLLPKLAALQVPILVLGADHDFFPEVIAGHIAQSSSAAQLVVLKDCGHFSYLECPDAVRTSVDAFIAEKTDTGYQR
jgi:proline iminopeptidase